MAKKRFLLGTLVMALAFGMTVVGCDNGSTDIGDKNEANGIEVSTSIEGTWQGSPSNFEFYNGNFEWNHRDYSNYLRGIYTVDAGIITLETTYIFGDVFRSEGYFDESLWYSRDEARICMKTFYSSPGALFFGVTDEEIELKLDRYYFIIALNYSVDGNILKLGNTTLIRR